MRGHAFPDFEYTRETRGRSGTRSSVRSVIADPEVSMMSEESPIVITESENDDGEKQHTDINSKEWLNDKVSTLALFYIFIAAGFFAHFFQVMPSISAFYSLKGKKYIAKYTWKYMCIAH